MPKVSVIVLIYNTEKYIERCARSLFEQTLDDIEYIFVNDCTPDNSINVLKEVMLDYPKRISNVKILHNERNKGQAYSREFGIKNATGDYVIHCDSDDWVDTEMYERLYVYAVDNNFDIVWCDFYRTDGKQYNRIYQVSETDRQSLIGNMLVGKIFASLCNRLYKRRLHENTDFVFPTANMTEDFVISLQLILLSSKIGYLATPLYYYYDNRHSISKTINALQIESNLNDMIKNQELVYSILKKYSLFEVLSEQYNFRSLLLKETLNPLLSKKSYRDLWKKTFSNINKDILNNKYLKKDFKRMFRTFCIIYDQYWLYKLVLCFRKSN